MAQQTSGPVSHSELNKPNGPAAQDPNGTIGAQRVLAAGGTKQRTLAAKASDYQVIFDFGDFGDICDGNSHPLSGLGYTTLLAAQQGGYPAATALAEQGRLGRHSMPGRPAPSAA